MAIQKPRPDPSVDDLRAIWEQVKPLRPAWPATFEETMRSPLRASIVRTLALHPEIAAQWLDIELKINAQRLTMPPREQRPRPRFLDWKSRAAGEKIDDD
jgi:hypothetical protein